MTKQLPPLSRSPAPMTDITLHYLSLPSRSALHIALAAMPGPYSVAICTKDWDDFIDADTVDDIYDFLKDEVKICHAFTLHVEQVVEECYDD